MDRDKDTPIMYEPDPTPMLVAPPFNEPVLGNDSQQVFAYHIYCEPNDGANLAARLECLAAQTIFAGDQCCHVCVSWYLQLHLVAGFTCVWLLMSAAVATMPATI